MRKKSEYIGGLRGEALTTVVVLPLALLLLTGLYLFVLPYATKWRRGWRTGGAVLE